MPAFNVVVTRNVNRKLNDTEYVNTEQLVVSGTVVAKDALAAAFLAGKAGAAEEYSTATVTVQQIKAT